MDPYVKRVAEAGSVSRMDTVKLRARTWAHGGTSRREDTPDASAAAFFVVCEKTRTVAFLRKIGFT